MVNTLENKLVFHNQVINKKKLQGLMYLTFHNFGVIRSSVIADRLKNLTFHYATVSGISLSVEDLRVPYSKRRLIGLTTDEVSVAEQNYNNGNVTVVERYQNVIDIWNNEYTVILRKYIKEKYLKFWKATFGRNFELERVNRENQEFRSKIELQNNISAEEKKQVGEELKQDID